jgi:glycosyltransferase involved in cell wall biosynthesis
MTTETLVSIGLPVYNGGKYLHRAITSLLSQDYRQIELIISDNASTDDTEAICRKFAGEDPRIRYYRAEQNMGAAWNFNRVFELSSGEYFMWAAHDDWRDESFVRLCMECLERESSAVLCFANTFMVFPDNRVTNAVSGLRLDQSHARQRFAEMLHCSCATRLVTIYGMIRASALRATTGAENYYCSDWGLLLQLCWQGSFIRCPDTSLYYQSKTQQEDAIQFYFCVSRLLHPNNRPRAYDLPCWRLGFHFLRIAWTVPATFRTRLLLTTYIMRDHFMARSRFIELCHAIESLAGIRSIRQSLQRRLKAFGKGRQKRH